MRIYNQNLSFKSARLNIVATSDNHGNIYSLPQLTETMKDNKNDIFIKADSPSTLNIFAIAGDWHINPMKTGFLTNPNTTNGELQKSFLDKTIEFVHNLAGKNNKFDSVFALGNHDLDGGDEFIYDAFKESNMKVLISNADFEQSPGLKNLMKQNNNVVKSFVYSIPDDKNPELENKVLFMGVTIPSMKLYNPGLLKRMELIDDCNKRDVNLTEADLQNTFRAISDQVKEFKKENPKGTVIVLSHTGGPISNMISSHAPDIDIILNAHDHKNITTIKDHPNGNKTVIASLGKDNEIFKSLNILFDDYGNLSSIDTNMYCCEHISNDAIQSNPIKIALSQDLKEDLKPLINLRDLYGNKSQLVYDDSIRYQNSYLANFLTNSIKQSIREITNNKDTIVGIQSSTIRGGLKDGSNNLDIMKIFDGASEDLSHMCVGNVSGNDLLGLIVENVKTNLKAPTRSTIIQWSDILVNKTLIKNILEGNSTEDIANSVKIRNSKNKGFEPINLEKQYSIALSEKFLAKKDIEYPKKVRDNFTSLNKTFDYLFKSYLASSDVNYQITLTPDIYEKRII